MDLDLDVLVADWKRHAAKRLVVIAPKNGFSVIQISKVSILFSWVVVRCDSSRSGNDGDAIGRIKRLP